MKINVTENKVSIKEEQILNENEYNIHKIQFDFSSEYTDDLVKVALFSIDNHTYKKIISNNECDIPPEVLTQRGYSILGVYAYKTEQDTLVLRYSPSPTRISVYDGSYKADAENSEPITPSEIEQYQQILQNSLQQFQNQYNALVEETEGDIQAIEDELQRKVDEGYFDGEDGFSPIAKVIQKSNGATIEIEDKNGKTTADVLNGQDGYSPIRGIDYWTEEDKQEVEEEATQQIEGKIEEYNDNAAEKLSQYNQNSVQKTNDYNTNAEQKMSTYNTNATEKLSTYNSNATEKFNSYNSNAEQKETNYNTNASQKVESFNTNASSKLSEYNLNAETKKSAYDENATQKTTSFNTNATNKLTEYNTNHTEKMSTYNSNSTEKLNAFNENATQKTEDFDEHTEEIQDNIEKLQTENARFKATLFTTGEVTGQDITLDKTAELEFKKPPLPMGNSEQVQYSGKNKIITFKTSSRDLIEYFFDKSINNSFIMSGLSNLTVSGFKATIKTSNGDINLGYKSIETNKNFSFTFSITTDDLSKIQNSTSTPFIQFWSSNGFAEVDFKNVMIRDSSITDDTYEPYVGGQASPNPDYPQEITNVTGDVEIVVENKNLLNTEIEQGSINSSGVEIEAPNRIRTKDYIKVKPNTNYTFSLNESSLQVYVFEYSNDKTFIQRIPVNWSSLPYNFITSSNTEYIKIIISKINTANITPNEVSKVQLEYGSIATNYVEHKEQTLPLTLGNIELCKIGDYQDYFYKESNKWYLHKEIDKVVLDGSENWIKTSDISASVFALNNIIYTSSYGRDGKGLSSHFKYAFSNSNGKFYWGNRNNLALCMENTYTLETFKTWLQSQYNNGIPVKVYYVLETPTDTEITDTTLISQLEAINNAISYEEQTNIRGSSNESNPIFSVEGYQSTKLVLQERDAKYESLEARVALLE